MDETANNDKDDSLVRKKLNEIIETSSTKNSALKKILKGLDEKNRKQHVKPRKK